MGCRMYCNSNVDLPSVISGRICCRSTGLFQLAELVKNLEGLLISNGERSRPISSNGIFT